MRIKALFEFLTKEYPQYNEFDVHVHRKHQAGALLKFDDVTIQYPEVVVHRPIEGQVECERVVFHIKFIDDNRRPCVIPLSKPLYIDAIKY